MSTESPISPSYEELLLEVERLQWQLEEANDTIHAIRTGQVDALVVTGAEGPQLYSLKTADQTYRVFVEQMNEGAITLNAEGLVLYCNPSFAHMLSTSAAKITGQHFEALITPDLRSDFHKLFDLSWTQDAKGEFIIQYAGRQLPCQLSLSVLQMDEGQSLSVIITDLSFQKETEAILKAGNNRLAAANTALEQSNHDLLQFASVASHDLQEPLRKIMVYSDLLAQKLPVTEDAGATLILSKIATSSQRMKTLIADILAYSQLTRDGTETGSVSLEEVLTGILDEYELLIRDKSASVDLGPMPVVQANRGQMWQVFQNLLSNALKFSRPGVDPLVKIAASWAPGATSCLIILSDNGIGFDNRYSDRIFSLFQRLNTKDKFEGSGIGLAVTKKIIEKHGGSISVDSEEGTGTTFKLILPLAPQ